MYLCEDVTMEKMTRYLFDCIQHKKIEKGVKQVAIIGVGTQKSYMDSIGGKIASCLKVITKNYKILGTIDDPIHAVSIMQREEELKELHENYVVVAIDASLSTFYRCVSVSENPVRPGAGLGKKLPLIGDLSVKLNLSESYVHDFEVSLKNQKTFNQQLSEAINLLSNIDCLLSKERDDMI